MQEFERVPEGVKEIKIHLHQDVGLIDHTSLENIKHSIRDFEHRDIPVTIMGLDRMRRLSEYHAATRVMVPEAAS